MFLREYEQAASTVVLDVHAWDVYFAAYAVSAVETWAPSYQVVGRTNLTPGRLRERFDAWLRYLSSTG